ncbi:PadR family transcriptional regulator [Devosia aurantiaca]|uniref:PadR family transcriptional regulator n=1 Tax=Devosia aurantiaca TaxID=2714858 RepID=A0A6M1SV19_9HYPH|nr:PadR family transcriptional regulator [Devosia aurantiaca]NGP16781.1 PadR family transcriptional regulator [Devosia aurantiaca]
MAHKDNDIDWKRFEQMARRGWGRMARMAGDEFGNLGNWGGNLRVGRMLASGDLRLVALYLIEQQPRHGYDLIKAVEERSKGVYSPSPGIVYPALTYLEEAGFVTSSADGNKKLYAITDEGRKHLEENRDAVSGTLDFLARTGEQMNRFREFVKADWPFGGEGRAEDGNVPPNWGNAARIVVLATSMRLTGLCMTPCRSLKLPARRSRMPSRKRVAVATSSSGRPQRSCAARRRKSWPLATTTSISKQ